MIGNHIKYIANKKYKQFQQFDDKNGSFESKYNICMFGSETID